MPQSASVACLAALLCGSILLTVSATASTAPATEPRTQHARRLGHALPPSWRLGRPLEPEEPVSFTVVLKQCGLDELERMVNERADPNNALYGQHMTQEDIDAVTSCGPRAEALRADLVAWLKQHSRKGARASPTTGIINVGAARASHVRVTATSDVAAEVLGAPFHQFERCVGPAVGSGAAGGACSKLSVRSRALGAVSLPSRFDAIVDFVAGATELIEPRHTRHTPIESGANVPPSAPGTVLNVSDPFVRPAELRTIYQVPRDLRGSNPNNQQGVAAFDDFYMPGDLCLSTPLLSEGEEFSYTLPAIQYRGPPFQDVGGQPPDTVESDLDMQTIVQMGPGVRTLFANRPPGEWILEWAQDAVANHDAKTGPFVWSMSYGWPEIFECTAGINVDCMAMGYNSTTYMAATNAQIMALTAKGVTVSISSGDDGSQANVGFGCPVDASAPLGQSLEDVMVPAPPEQCPFGDHHADNCKCATTVITYASADGKHMSSCLLPLGAFVGAQVAPTMAGAQCEAVGTAPECSTLIRKMLANNGKSMPGVQKGTNCTSNTYGVELVPWGGTTNISATAPFVLSDCECGNIKPLTVSTASGTCSLAGYVGATDPATRLAPVFTPNFPTSSPWVTSIGASQVSMQQAECSEASIFADLDNAEMPCNKLTGEFDGGGGFSTMFGQPAWQKDAVAKYLQSGKAPPTSTFTPTNRGFPDMSLVGHNYLIVAASKPRTVGGTSASTPAWSGMVSLLNDMLLNHGKTTLGHLNPLLYDMHANCPRCFHAVKPHTFTFGGQSVMPGGNGCSRWTCCEYQYASTEDASWDPVTGIGSPNWAEMRAYIMKKKDVTPPDGEVTFTIRLISSAGTDMSRASAADKAALVHVLALNLAVAEEHLAITDFESASSDVPASVTMAAGAGDAVGATPATLGAGVDVTVRVVALDDGFALTFAHRVQRQLMAGTITRSLSAMQGLGVFKNAAAFAVGSPTASSGAAWSSTTTTLLVLFIVAMLAFLVAVVWGVGKNRELQAARPYSAAVLSG